MKAHKTIEKSCGHLLLRAKARYDGTPFHGWQIQPDCRTVQGDIDAALSQIAGAPVHVQGASRTDAGVHALGQVFAFRWPADKPWGRLGRALSSMLKPHIRVESVEPAPKDFCPRRSARGKRYAYAFELARTPDPFLAPYAWLLPWDLDLIRLAEGLRRIEGRHDFAGFESAGSPAGSTVRTLFLARLLPGGFAGPSDAQHLWHIELMGNGFLYHMVRNIAGTLVEIARGRLPIEALDERLASPGPFQGLTAPAQGLALLDLYYEGLPEEHGRRGACY